MTGWAPDAASGLAEKLVVEEYKVIRDDQHVSWAAAQATVARGLTATGVLLGATLVAAGKALDSPTFFFDLVVLVGLGILTPGVVVASAVVWLGEIIRAERASLQLVRFERDMDALPKVAQRKFGYFHAASAKNALEGEQSASTIGVVVIFAATGSVPFVLGYCWMYVTTSWTNIAMGAGIIIAAVVLAAGAFAGERLSRRILMIRDVIHAEALGDPTPPITRYVWYRSSRTLFRADAGSEGT